MQIASTAPRRQRPAHPAGDTWRAPPNVHNQRTPMVPRGNQGEPEDCVCIPHVPRESEEFHGAPPAFLLYPFLLAYRFSASLQCAERSGPSSPSPKLRSARHWPILSQACPGEFLCAVFSKSNLISHFFLVLCTSRSP